MRRGRSIVFNLKAVGRTGEIVKTSVSIDETIADMFCLKNNNILCDKVGEKFLRNWCQAKSDEFKISKDGISAYLRDLILEEIVRPDVVEKYRHVMFES